MWLAEREGGQERLSRDALGVLPSAAKFQFLTAFLTQ